MKGKVILYIGIAAIAATLSSCQKDGSPASGASDRSASPFVFTVVRLDGDEDSSAAVATKAVTETTFSTLTASSIKVTAQYQRLDELMFENLTFDKKSNATSSSATFQTSEAYAWPTSGALSFYSDNAPAANASYFEEDDEDTYRYRRCFNTTDGDVVAAYRLNVSNGSAVNLTYSHVFGRLYSIVLTAGTGVTSVTVNSISVTYYQTGYWDYDDEDFYDVTNKTTVSFPASTTSTGDILVIPSVSTEIKIKYTATTESGSSTYTKTFKMSFDAGTKTTLTGTLDASPAELKLQPVATPWTVSSLSQTY